MGYYYFDYTYFLFMIPALILSMIAQAKVQSTFHKYAKMSSARRLTGSEAAQQVLLSNGVTGVRVEQVGGNLTDHFDPRTNVIRLSDSVCYNSSVAAVGVAAHEAGHAVQHAVGYLPIKIRGFLVPITQFGSRLAVPLILIGMLLPVQYDFVVNVGIALYSLAVLFELVTLPVEFNASRRAIKSLGEANILYGEELEGAKKVLTAAAMTYLASTFTALLSLLRLLLIFGRRNNR